MDSSNQLLNVIHNDQLTIREEIQSSNVRLDNVVEVLQDQFTFTKDLANMESLQSETEELQQIEQQAEQGRGLDIGAKARSGVEAGSSFLNNMGRSILGGLRMPTLGSVLRGGIIAALGAQFGDEIGEFLSKELEYVFGVAGFSDDLTESFKSQVAEYTGPVLVGAGLGSIFGAKGAIIGAIGGYLVKYLGVDELWSELEAASSDEEKEKIKKEFADQALARLKENPAPALLLAGSLFGVKGLIVAGVATFLYTSLGLEALLTSEGRAAFGQDLFNAVMAKVTGSKVSALSNVEQLELDEINKISPMIRSPEMNERYAQLQQQSGQEEDLDLGMGLMAEGTQSLGRTAAMRLAQGKNPMRLGGYYGLGNLLPGRQETAEEAARRAAKTATSEAAEEAGERIVRGVRSNGVEYFRDTATNKFIGREAAEQILKTGGREAAEQAAETIAVTTTKTVLKKLPLGIGLAFSVPFAIGRAMKGDYVGAGLEIASGLASIVPGPGTAASLSIDAVSATRDVYGAVMNPAVDNNQVSELTQAVVAGSQQVSLVAPVNVTNNYDQSQVVTESGGSQGNIAAGSVSDGYVSSKVIAGRL